MNKINNNRVDTTNSMLKAQSRRYYKYNISRMESKPIFCTYFNIDMGTSTMSKGLGAVYEKAGKNTPLRFNKINNVPLYGFREFNRETNKTEYKGVSVDLNNESIIPAGSFEPYVNDFLIIHLDDADLIFEVSLAQPTSLVSTPHYRIAYSFSAEKTKDKQSMQDILDNVVGEYDFLIDNVGTNRHALLDVKTVKNINELTYIYQRINDSYKSNFYDENNNLLLFTQASFDEANSCPIITNYYCPALVEFQARHKPMMYRFDENGSLELLLVQEVMDYYEYHDTPYGALSYALDNKLDNLNVLSIEDLKSGGKYDHLMSTFTRPRYLTALNNFVRQQEQVMEIKYMSDKQHFALMKQFKQNINKEEFEQLHHITINNDSEIFPTLETILSNGVLENSDVLTNFKIKNELEYFIYVPIILMLLKNKIIEMQLNPKTLLDNIPTIK